MQGIAVKSGVVRDNFSATIDEVIHSGPKVVNRNRDHFMMLSPNHLASIMEDVSIHATVQLDADGSYIASLREIDDLIASGETAEAAVRALAEDLIEYAFEYLSNFQMYLNAPNRRGHVKYVMKVLLSDSPDEVVSLLNAQSA